MLPVTPKAKRDIVNVRQGFQPFSLAILSETFQTLSQSQAEHSRPHARPLLDIALTDDCSGLPGVYPGKHVSMHCAVALGCTRLEHWHENGHLSKRRFLSYGFEGVGAVCEDEPVAGLV